MNPQSQFPPPTLLPLPLLLLLLLCLPALYFAQPHVLDSDGDALQRARRYYLQAAGGLVLGPATEPCPTHLAMARSTAGPGKALAFFPENPKSKTVSAGHTLYVRLAACAGLWRVRADRAGLVTTDGTGSAAIGPHDSRFAVSSEKGDGRRYRIWACPCSVGVDRGSCRMGCLGPLGLTRSNLLGLADGRPLLVSFVKA